MGHLSIYRGRCIDRRRRDTVRHTEMKWNQLVIINPDPQEEQRETPTEYHAWFKPFHEALTSGMVDGGSARSQGNTTSGDVSDIPESDSNA